jgi:hypothetical protein
MATLAGGFFKAVALAAAGGFALEDMSLWLSSQFLVIRRRLGSCGPPPLTTP